MDYEFILTETGFKTDHEDNYTFFEIEIKKENEKIATVMGYRIDTPKKWWIEIEELISEKEIDDELSDWIYFTAEKFAEDYYSCQINCENKKNFKKED